MSYVHVRVQFLRGNCQIELDSLLFSALTQNGDHYLGLHGLGTHAVAGLAAVPRVVVVGRRDEVVHVPALSTVNWIRFHLLQVFFLFLDKVKKLYEGADECD